ncbi:similar to Shb-like adapter protein, Shf - human (predicted), isoform CRA_b, partial [Rattus norvegicus]
MGRGAHSPVGQKRISALSSGPARRGRTRCPLSNCWLWEPEMS